MGVSSRPGAASAAHAGQVSPERPVVVDTEPEVQQLVGALEDADCRRILEATAGEALSAKEVVEACDLPLSSAYRKLDRLTEAGLLEAGTRIHRSGKHASEYSRLVDDVVVTLDDANGLQLEVTYREDAGRHQGPGWRLRG